MPRHSRHAIRHSHLSRLISPPADADDFTLLLHYYRYAALLPRC